MALAHVVHCRPHVVVLQLQLYAVVAPAIALTNARSGNECANVCRVYIAGVYGVLVRGGHG